MEELLTKAIPSMGSAGILAVVLWNIAKRFMDETVKQMGSRIDALERSVEECSKDRRQMHAEIVSLVRKIDDK
jgi:septal ring factor EnvC (AmiA/AmiB activator)